MALISLFTSGNKHETWVHQGTTNGQSHDQNAVNIHSFRSAINSALPPHKSITVQPSAAAAFNTDRNARTAAKCVLYVRGRQKKKRKEEEAEKGRRAKGRDVSDHKLIIIYNIIYIYI